MGSIFISYAHSDGSEAAEYLHRALTGAGFEVFKDNHSLSGGQQFPEALASHVSGMEYFIVLISEAAVNSRWVSTEINIAMNEGSTIIPIRLDDAKVPTIIATLHGYDMRERGLYWKALHHLVNSLEGGEDIPRVYNMTKYDDFVVDGVLVLDDYGPHKVDWDSSDRMIEEAKKNCRSGIADDKTRRCWDHS